ncbi:unnamed protein product [Linum tenue]|uniref:Uncharacterized protein n=1 Tax=Linum tenue TaxID=586396 RepID=A0AAV0IYE1_9ROSI|nr:unnamed protein product [Linum tenue]
MTGISLTGDHTAFLPRMLNVLLLNLPSTKAKLRAISSPTRPKGLPPPLPLGPAHQLGSGLGPCREWVVDHCHHAEARRREIGGGGPDDLHRRWVGPGDDVVEVEAEVAELFFLEAERRRRQDPGVAITGFWFLGRDEREREGGG